MNVLTLITTSPITGHEYRIADATPPEWFTHYGEDGSGFGYLTFKLKRRPGFNYMDVGHGFRVQLLKGWRVLFDGQIVRITERSGHDGGVEIWALGWVHLMQSDTYNWIYCDTRADMWKTDEQPAGLYRPDHFDWQKEESSITVYPRRGTDYEASEYVLARYTFSFGETVSRFKADYRLSMPSEWLSEGGLLRLELADSNDAILWSTVVDGSGSLDLAVTGAPAWIEVHLVFVNAGEHTRETDDVFGQLSNIHVYSVNVQTLDAKIIADDLVAYMYRDGKGLSASTAKVYQPGLALEPVIFETDMTPTEVLTWCCQFGDAYNHPLAWGVTFDDNHYLFLEPVDLTNIRYVIDGHDASLEIERVGDWEDSAQKVYAIYQDSDQQIVRTGDITASAVLAKLGGFYRRLPLQINAPVSGAMALALALTWLAENQYPAVSGSITVHGGVRTPDGRFVPVEDILAGGLVQVREWRAQEALLSANDYRDQTTTFPLAGVKIDYASRSAELIPRATSDVFARQMAIIEQLKRSV